MFHTSEYPAKCQVRTYDIEAISLPIVYNKYGDHDPDGLLFVPLSQVEDIRCGKKRPVPLILRANADPARQSHICGTLTRSIKPVCWTPLEICEITAITACLVPLSSSRPGQNTTAPLFRWKKVWHRK